ncbi:TPA: hypothetical protein DCZ39_04465 [Patescibacteria group bacterium]|nr:hypothetical protein [Candidatus Gracilibacteria bacterium]
MEEDDNLHKLSEFFKITGKDSEEKKTLLEIYADKDTSSLDKTLIKEFLDNSNEKEESLDSDVSKNPTAVS